MYISIKDAEAEYSISKTTVYSVLKVIRENIGKRYPERAIIQTGKIIRVRDDVFQDAIYNRDLIEIECAEKFVPEIRHAYM